MSFSDFSSWPRDQEQSFVVYEQRAVESSKKAVTIATIAGVAFFLLMVGIYVGVEPDKHDITKDMNMENLTKKSKREAPAAAPEPPKAEAAPAAEAPAGESGEAVEAPAE